MCRLSWSFGTSTSWNPEGLSRPVQHCCTVPTLVKVHYSEPPENAYTLDCLKKGWKRNLELIYLSFLHCRINCRQQEVKAKGHKENSPKENENIRQGSQGRYIDRTRRIHVRILFVNIYRFDLDNSVTMSTRVRAERQGIVARLGQGEEIRLSSEMSRPSHLNWVPGFVPGDKVEGAWGSPRPSRIAEFENDLSYASTSPYVFMTGCLISKAKTSLSYGSPHLAICFLFPTEYFDITDLQFLQAVRQATPTVSPATFHDAYSDKALKVSVLGKHT